MREETPLFGYSYSITHYRSELKFEKKHKSVIQWMNDIYMLREVITDHGDPERRITEKHYVIDYERMKWKAEHSLKFTDLHYTSSTHTDLVKYIRATFRSKLEKMDAFQ